MDISSMTTTIRMKTTNKQTNNTIRSTKPHTATLLGVFASNRTLNTGTLRFEYIYEMLTKNMRVSYSIATEKTNDLVHYRIV